MKNKFIFKNCINNKVSVSMNFNKGEITNISKSTYSEQYFDDLQREFEGYKWYSEYQPIEVKLKKNDIFNNMELSIQYIKGNKKKFNKGISNNFDAIMLAISYYNSISNLEFSKTKKLPFHGDFSIDNIIYKKNNLYIIDWQYFHFSEFYRGFDILNLIFEQLYFDYYRKFSILRSLKKPKNKLIFILKYAFSNHMIDDYFKENPLSKIRSYIFSNKSKIWNNQIYKLPVVKFRNNDVSYIDNYIKLHIT